MNPISKKKKTGRDLLVIPHQKLTYDSSLLHARIGRLGSRMRQDGECEHVRISLLRLGRFLRRPPGERERNNSFL